MSNLSSGNVRRKGWTPESWRVPVMQVVGSKGAGGFFFFFFFSTSRVTQRASGPSLCLHNAFTTDRHSWRRNSRSLPVKDVYFAR
ncbi:hypothetical protein LX36DRAFT_304319 [Colletotrichum falcatum]|nr:hypothetical protein LX36DRAFT_304319 [Colletotrichum falcatum]